MLRFATLVSSVSALATFSVPALANQVHYFGQTRLAYAENDLDAIHVPGACFSAWNPGVTKLKLRMMQGSAEVEALSVVYGDGRLDFLAVRGHFNRGTESRWIDLEGGRRCIKKIYILGDTDNTQPRRAEASVYGYAP